jgi:phospholipase/carboxylesterase
MAYDIHLRARPTATTQRAPTGLQALNFGSKRDKSYFYVPQQYQPQQPSPLVLILHGAGGHARHPLPSLQTMADKAGVILVTPTSNWDTWDMIIGRAYAPDVELLDESLERVCNDYAVDPTHLAVGGFADGASCALSLGVTNSDLFTHVIAFSPGFLVPAARHEHPQFFISHGKNDDVLPIAACSRYIVSCLKYSGYEVDYREFDGGHTVPPDIAQAAVNWFIRKNGNADVRSTAI